MVFRSEQEVDDFLSGFESGLIPQDQWNHRAHLAAAGALVWRDPAGALPAMRLGILLQNRNHETKNTPSGGYHETLTVFWISVVRTFCAGRRSGGRLAMLDEMMRTLPANLHEQYYGFDVVKSRTAREHWVEPDLQALPE